MTKKIKKLEKETTMYRSRWESSNKALLEMAEEVRRLRLLCAEAGSWSGVVMCCVALGWRRGIAGQLLPYCRQAGAGGARVSLWLDFLPCTRW